MLLYADLVVGVQHISSLLKHWQTSVVMLGSCNIIPENDVDITDKQINK